MGTGPVTGKPRMQSGPETYEVFEQVNAGQLTMPGTAGNAAKIGVAGADAANCLGVASKTALPAGTAYSGTTSYGQPYVDASVPQEFVAVYNEGDFWLTAGGTIAFGDQVKCGANGTVVKLTVGTDNAALKIGKCIDTAGGVNGGSVLIHVDI